MATERVTKAGTYVETSGASLQATAVGAYIEISEPFEISSQVTLAGTYVEITSAMDRVTLAGVYVEMHTEEYVSKAGTYVEFYVPPPPKPSYSRLSDFRVAFQSLAFAPIVNPPFEIKPIRWSWQLLGGCHHAEIAVSADINTLINYMPELPRMPVEIINNVGSVVWFGYVNTVEVKIGELVIAATLDGMANRVIISYDRLLDGETEPTHSYTSLLEDADSVSRFGKFELLYEYGTASPAQASALRALIVKELAKLQSDSRLENGQGVSAKLLCNGWIHSFAWQIFEEASTTDIAISDQVGQIASGMQFIDVVDIVSENTIESNPYREPQSAYDVLDELMLIADSDNNTMIATIPQRGVFRYRADNDEDQFIRVGGRFLRGDRSQLQDGEMILGWCRDLNTRLIGNLSEANRFYVVESEYEDGDYTIRSRGTDSPWRQ